jgi:predicted TIM-barrel fold metal-dependent hydrolase
MILYSFVCNVNRNFKNCIQIGDKVEREALSWLAVDGVIDAHVHLWTDQRERYPRLAVAREYPPESFTPRDFLAHAQPHGVTRAVLVQMSFYGFDNSYMLDSMRARPDVFSGIAFVDAAAPDPASAMRALSQLGVRGFRIVTAEFSRNWLDHPGAAAMWRCGGDRRLALCLLIDAEMLPAAASMCERFPDTPVVIDHLARIGVNGEIRDSDTRLLCSLAKYRNVYVKVSAFYALGRKQSPYGDLVPLIHRVFDDYGPRRLMWGSDCPFQVEDGRSYAPSLALVREGLPFLSAEDRAWLLGRTAESVFFTA